MKGRRWFIAVFLVIAVVAIVGPVIWFRILKDDPPPPLSFADITATTRPPVVAVSEPTSTSTSLGTILRRDMRGAPTPATTPGATVSASEVEGKWHVAGGSISGYRVRETVGVTSQDAVGRTEKVSGALNIANNAVTSGSWTTDMASVVSDEDRRDSAYRDSMDVEHHPTSVFVLGEPIALGEVPANGVDITVPVRGSLTLRGETRAVSFTVRARRANSRIEVVGSIPVRFEDYKIPNPSNGYARTEDHGLVEFLLLFEHR